MTSADGKVLFAWWDGQNWQPDWWHVVDAKGTSAAIYGRDWQAIATNNPPPVPPTPTPTPDPAQVHYVDATKAITVPAGARGNVTIALTIKNIGSVSWSSDAGFSFAGFYCLGEGCPAAVGLGVMDFQQPFGSVIVPPGATHQFLLSTPLDTTAISGQNYPVLWKLFQDGAPVPDDNDLSISNFCQFCTTIEVGAPLPTTTPPRLGDKSSWIANSPPQTVQLRQQFSITFTYKNTGTTTWSDSGGYALVCDTHYHPNNNNCMGDQRAGLGGQTIPPDQQFTFTLNLIAPSSPGTYQIWWDMAHNGSIFGNNSSYVTIIVQGSNPITPTPTSTPTDTAKILGQSTWPTVQAGQQYTIYFVLQNTGTTTWSDAGAYDLACTSLCLDAPSAIRFSGQSVGPTQQYQFNINQVAPSTPGTYRTDWALEHNGQPFGPGLYIYVTVPVLQQQAPVCTNPGGTNWSSPNPTAVNYSCPGNGLLVQQVSSTKYAEFDLTQANGGSYNQTNFQVQVQAIFQNTGDCNTWAAIIFQTPVNGPGGNIFGITPCGQWRLQQVISGTVIPVVAKGSIGINASQPVTIILGVQKGMLNVSINNQQILTSSVGSPSGAAEVGLMVERDNAAPSSPVLYSNFELDA